VWNTLLLAQILFYWSTTNRVIANESKGSGKGKTGSAKKASAKKPSAKKTK
jgi:hypothetical protein